MQELKQYLGRKNNIKVAVRYLGETPCGIVQSNPTMACLYGKWIHSRALKRKQTSGTNVKYNIVTPMW